MAGTNFPNGILVNKQALALDTKIGQANISPASIPAGSGATSSLSVPGVVLGKWEVSVIAPGDLQGVNATGYVSAKDTVAIRFQNGTAGAVTPPAGVYTVQCLKVVP